MPTVYIETTVPSYYHETRRTPEAIMWRSATRTWWDLHRHRYELATSDFVIAELRNSPAGKARAMLEMMAPVRRLAERPETQEVAAYYVEHKLMPEDAVGDAAHLAMASVHGVEFLLTWNCKHLANANKVQHLRVLNSRLGLPIPVLTTPLMLVPEISP
jgi:hypothetical protein